MKSKNQIYSFDSHITDKTEQTDYRVTNQEFFHAVFENRYENSFPAFVSFKGSPSDNSWSEKKWQGELLDISNNNYFSISTYKSIDGHFKRKTENFVATHALVLDDVGTKVNASNIALQPSWIIETSPDNFQCGYIFKKPLNDLAQVKKLFKDVIKAGISDPGMDGPSTRLARLPGVNGKYMPNVQCILRAWSPELKYSLNELYTGLNIANLDNSTSSDAIWRQKLNQNPVIEKLTERDLYKSKIEEGKHDITCPWVHEHTNETDSGTAYFEPSSEYPSGGFKCFHGHCAERRIKDLLEYLLVDELQATMKPIIRLIPGEIHRIIDFAEKELADSGRYYQQNGHIVYLAIDPRLGETKVEISTPNELTKTLSEMIVWLSPDKRIKGDKKVDPPIRPINVLTEGPSFKYLPVLRGISKQPYFRPDGTLVLNSGYDEKSGVYGDFIGNQFEIPEFPSRDDAAKALETLKELLSEFSFRDETDQAATLAAILTATIRPVLKNAPMFHVRAHMIGSGKSYLCSLISVFATPQPTHAFSFPGNEEECNKLLLAELLTNPHIIEFDNLTSDLVPYKSLCTVLTSELIKSRILGVSRTASVSTRALFLSSGNNVGPLKDMTRRCVTINISPETEVPAARSFRRPNLIEEVRKEREKYVSYALTIIRAWICAGQPLTKCKSLNGFADWSNLCVQPLLWLGAADPVESVMNAILKDPDRECLEYLIFLWEDRFGNRPVMVRDLIKRAIGEYGFSDADEELKDALMDIAGETGGINRRRLGKWITRHVGQIVGGVILAVVSGSRSSKAWRLEQTKSVSSVMSVSNSTPKEIHDGSF